MNLSYLREEEGKSDLSRNFHEFFIVSGTSPSPVVDTINTINFEVGSFIIGNSSNSIIFGVKDLFMAYLPSSSAAYLAVLV